MPLTDISYRPLAATELDRVDEIDRSEVVHQIYRHRDGVLELEDNFWDGKGWPGWDDETRQRLSTCLANGGAVWGAFDGDRMVGIAALDGDRIGANLDRLDLYFLHTTNGYRGTGIGHRLIDLAIDRARELGARSLYVSATPSLNTVTFYQRRGCTLASEVDPELFALEPEDIHMELDLQAADTSTLK